ncbi:MAG: hypothetical protein ACKV19_03665 [Verrucomicrobiales bacterium]
MNLHHALATAVAMLTTLCSVANATIYYIAPVPLDDDYAIAGGFITTNGRIGSLRELDILDYRIEIAGPIPFVFRAANDGAPAPSHFGLTATPTDLYLETDATTSVGDSPTLHISASDNTLFDCGECYQSLRYISQSFPSDSRTEIMYSFVDENGGLDVRANLRLDPQTRFRVATIPEPSCLTLVSLASLIGIVRRRRRNRPA